MEENHHLLYQKFLTGACSDAELSALFKQFGTADEDQLKHAIMQELSSVDAETPANDDEAARLERIRMTIMNQVGSSRKGSVRKLFYGLSAAATILLAATTAVIFWQRDGGKQQAAKQQAVVVVKPGQNQATLTLANGKKIILSSSIKGVVGTLGQTSVNVNPSGGVAYVATGADQTSANALNTLSTARGEQSPYPLVLADGSKIWLNAASSVTFPTRFTGAERVVTVTGEAYFEIAHNKNKPFKVITDRQEVTVLGTHFNINAYQDEQAIRTSLIQGSVKVVDIATGASGILVPGQQSKLNRTGGPIVLKTVNMDEVLAWKNGFFMFDDQSVARVMRSVSRWYNVEVEYRQFNDKNEKFGGTFSRSSNLSDILNSLQMLGSARFKIEGRKIIVSN